MRSGDIDLLPELGSGEQWSLMDLARVEEESSLLVGRKADLVDGKYLERSANGCRRDAILNSLEVVYVACFAASRLGTVGSHLTGKP